MGSKASLDEVNNSKDNEIQSHKGEVKFPEKIKRVR